MRATAKKIAWSVLGAILSAVVGLVARKVLQTWGILDPLSEWLGGWLKMHVSQTQAEWTIVGITTLAAYAGFLWVVWKHHRVPQISGPRGDVGVDRTRPTAMSTSDVSPLEIVFDLYNPGEQFWKRRQGKDASGNQIPKMVLEHRIGVRNTSSTTVRKVSVSIETLGIIPIDPRDMRFQKGDKESFDITPGHMELVPVWWVWPPEAGDAWGSTATAFHGPLRVTARGDDVYPAKAEFDYFPAQVPALVRRAIE